MASAPLLTKCQGCGGVVPGIEGPTHPYMLSAPGCWSLYGEVLAREYSDPAWSRLHRLTVDCYAVQHPQSRDRRNRQSVAIHLMSLCLVLERGGSDAEARALLSRSARRADEWPALPVPADLGAVTTADVHRAASLDAHLALVSEWAASAWGAWAAEHERVRGWLDGTASSGSTAPRVDTR